MNSRKNDPDFKVNQQDVKFLKSLRISIDYAAIKPPDACRRYSSGWHPDRAC